MTSNRRTAPFGGIYIWYKFILKKFGMGQVNEIG
jgi:hypothetical protein